MIVIKLAGINAKAIQTKKTKFEEFLTLDLLFVWKGIGKEYTFAYINRKHTEILTFFPAIALIILDM
jgi:hypothetical protein